ncbi:MAG TPA: DUF2934 domain-containing protein [Acetobacteraceae bacterium]|jgi:hypothetical protein|nr:DUF2934 domain-containing protein [Acetobacteraceae bacterium]
MSDNPLDPSPEFESRVRERAYLMWEQEGRPEGRDQEYWERARELEAMTAHPDAALLPNPKTEYGEPPPPEPVEEAEIMENYGEFPDRLTDQGEHLSTPMPKERARDSGE